MGEERRLGIQDFAELFGIAVEQMPERARQAVRDYGFGYEILTGAARDAVILRILQNLDADMSMAGPGRLDRWESGWSENLREFQDAGYDVRRLLPKYYLSGNNAVLRLHGEYVLPTAGDFEVRFLKVMREILAGRYLTSVGAIYEFGCGPAHNLVAFGEILPGKKLVGLDWAPSSQAIIDVLRERCGLNVEGRRFDFFNPDPDLKLPANTAVVTFGGLEQTGHRSQAFLDYLLAQGPAIVVHVEPIYELYDLQHLPDFLAAAYSRKRGYLRGFLTALREQEQAGVLCLEPPRKLLGSMCHDGWTLVVWRPAG